MEDERNGIVEVNGKTVEYIGVSPVGAVCPDCGADRGISCKELLRDEFHAGATAAAEEATARRGEQIRAMLEESPNAIISSVVSIR